MSISNKVIYINYKFGLKSLIRKFKSLCFIVMPKYKICKCKTPEYFFLI